MAKWGRKATFAAKTSIFHQTLQVSKTCKVSEGQYWITGIKTDIQIYFKEF